MITPLQPSSLSRSFVVSSVLLVIVRYATGAALPHPEPHPSVVPGEAAYAVRDEPLIIEAEAGSGEWERVDESGVAAIRARRGARMLYRIQFVRPGIYYLHLRCHHAAGMKDEAGKVLAGSSTNDAAITIGGARLYGSDGHTRPEGMRCHTRDFRWTSLPKGPGGHTPDAIRDRPVHFLVPKPGAYELVIAYRSPGFVIDQIAITTEPRPPGSTPP